MSQGCFHREEMNAAEAAWLRGNTNPRRNEGEEGRKDQG